MVAQSTLTETRPSEERQSIEPKLEQALDHLAAGALAEAAECCFAVIALDPASARAWKYLGDVLRRLDEFEPAHDAYRTALSHQTVFPEAWFALATLLTRLRRLDEASEAFRITLEQDPACFEAHTNLGVLHWLAGRLDKALIHARLAQSVQPGNLRALVLEAQVLLRLGRLVEAEAACRTVLAAQPDHAEATRLLGRLLYQAERPEEACAVLEQALALAPDHAEAHHDLGVTLKVLGRIDAARHHIREALRLDPALHGAWYAIRDLVDFAAEPELASQVRRMTRALIDDPRRLTHVNDPLIPLHFIHGKMSEDLGDHDEALAHYTAGSRLKRATLTFDEAAHSEFCRATKARFNREFFSRHGIVGDDSVAPVFLVGMPRSGSTLVEQILAGHPAIRAGDEVRHLPDAIEACRRHDHAFPAYPALAGALTPERAERIAATYLESALGGAPLTGGVRHFTDKLLTNYFYIGLIHALFPKARIINTLRNPLDTCLSTYATLFAEDVPWSYDLGELGRHYARYVDLMAHWRSVLPAGVMTSVAYEDLVSDPAGETHRLLEFLGLPRNDACLSFHTLGRPVNTASSAQVRKPLYTSSIERARRFGSGLDPLVQALRPTTGLPGGLPL